MIRARRDEDLDELVALLRTVYLSDSYPANWPKGATRWVQGDHALAAWVSEEHRKLVGHVALSTPDPARSWQDWQEALGLPPERLAVVRRLFVAPDNRRRGLATCLLERCQREAAGRGLHLVLDVAEDNHAAIAFWETHGWQRVGEATLPPGDEGRALRLWLFVAPVAA